MHYSSSRGATSMSKLSDFLQLYNARSNATKKTYRTAIKHFLEFTYSEPLASLDDLSDRYFVEGRDYDADVKNYVLHITKQKTPKTVTTYITALRQFLIRNDVDFSSRFWKEVNLSRPKGKGARTRDRIPTTTELKHLLDHMPVQGKALFLLMATSGIRLNEALHLTLDDIHFQNGMNLIDIRHAKSGNPRDGFFTDEAKEYLELYLRNRDRYLEQAVSRSRRFKKSFDDFRLFPFESMTAYKIWNGALEKAGLGQKDRETHYHVLRVHSLRKFTRTVLGRAGVQRDHINIILGHDVGEDKSYLQPTREEVWHSHQSAWHEMSVFGTTNREEVDELHRRQVEDRNTLSDVVKENLALQKQVLELESKLKRQVDILQQQIREIQMTRNQSDEIMNRVFENPEFRRILRKTLRELDSNTKR